MPPKRACRNKDKIMTRHFENAQSVQDQLDEIRTLKEKIAVLEDELKTYMESKDIEVLNGITTKYTKTWVKDTLLFDSTKFKTDHADLYEQYKTKEKAGYYRFKEEVKK